MKFNDIFVSCEHYFSVGIEEDSGRYYISIPVSNNRVDYEEYYFIEKTLFEQHQSDLNQLKLVADECRQRKRDRDLIIQPGADRGWPV